MLAQPEINSGLADDRKSRNVGVLNGGLSGNRKTTGSTPRDARHRQQQEKQAMAQTSGKSKMQVRRASKAKRATKSSKASARAQTVLKVESSGPKVRALQKKLKDNGFDPGLADGVFGLGTEAAVLAFQKSEGLTPDGIAGPHTQAALVASPAPGAPQVAGATGATDVTDSVTVAEVSRMCPAAPLGNIKANLAPILQALSALSLGDKPMVLMAIATIRAETGGFEPISEGKSRFNTSPEGHPFDLYDNRKDLGNHGAPDGANFKGRGFVQLTGRFNYEKYDGELGLGGRLVANPELANDPTIAAQLLARFLKDKEAPIRAALHEGDLAQARRLVNGGSHGLAEFIDAFNIGNRIID
jgi:putative chitinase